MDLKNELLARIDFVREYQEIGLRFADENPSPSSTGWVPCFSLDRDEKNPSAAVNLQNGFYTDLGTGGRRLDFFALMQIFGGYSGGFREVLKTFAEKYGLQVPKGRPANRPENVLSFLPWNPVADRWCAAKSTTQEAVQMCGGEFCRYMQNFFCIGLKIFQDPASLDTVSGYVIAQTNGEPIPVRNREGKEIGACKIKTVSGSGSGLIGEHALLTIAESRQKNSLDDLIIFKVEGVSDMLSLQARIPAEMRKKILVLTNSAGCSEKPKEAWKSAFSGAKVVVIHDADVPGQKGVKNWQKFLSGIAKSVKAVTLPYEISQNKGRDLKDFFTDGHTFDELLALVKKSEEVTLDASDDDLDLIGLENDNPERLARLFLESSYKIPEVKGLYSLVYQSSGWYEYFHGAYRSLSESLIQNRLVGFILEQFREDWREAYREWENTGAGDQPKVRSISNALVSNALTVLRSLVFAESDKSRYWRVSDVPEPFQDVTQLIPVENGIISLNQMAVSDSNTPLEEYFLPATPTFFNLNAIPVEYSKTHWSPTWQRMLQQNLAEDSGTGKLDLIQQFFGYCLLPESKLSKFLILTGEGKNGKSAVLTGFSAMIGESNVANVPLESFGDRFSMTAIQNKLVNIVDDLNETDKTCEGRLKSIVSGTAISTDRKNKESISFRPYCRLVFACNVLPRFQDTSDGIWRRMEVVPFENIIPDSECRPEFVTAEFWEKEKNGIFNWCLVGLLRLKKNGWRLPESASAAAAKISYRYDVNPVLEFFDDTIELNEYATEPVQTVYKAYCRWCAEKGYKSKSERNFGKELWRKFPDMKKLRQTAMGRRIWVYGGIRLLPEERDF